LAVFVGVLVTQFAWAWAVPPFRGSDEIDHVFRAASVARGVVNPTGIPADGRGALGPVPPGLAAAARAQCESLKYNGRSNCIPDRTLPDGDVLLASSAAGYSPVFYAAIGQVTKAWDGVTALYIMRGVASVLNALLVAMAAWCLMAGARTQWSIVGFLVGLTPMAMYTLMLPAPNGIELAAALALWCALLGLHDAEPRVRRWMLATAGIAGVVLGSVRMTGPVFILLIVGFVIAAAPRRTGQFVRQDWKGLLLAAAPTAGAAMYQVAWARQHPPLPGDGSGHGVPLDLGLIFQQVLLWPFQWIGAFPLRNQPASPFTYIAVALLMLLLIFMSVRHGSTKPWAGFGVVVTCLVLPLVYTFATFSQEGTSWQGRYALPLLVGAPILWGLAIKEPGRGRHVPWVVPLLIAAGTATATAHVVSLEAGRSASAGDPHWHRPSMMALVLLALVAAAAFNRAIIWAGARPGPDAAASSDPGRLVSDTPDVTVTS
jgi:hypothetical protein